MKTTFYPSFLNGSINLPSSKSLTHRALICAALADGESQIINPLYCDDTLATMSCLKALGVEITSKDNALLIKSNKNLLIKDKIDVGESASTLRFLIPILLHFQDKVRIYASNRLIQRIQTKDLMSLKGLNFNFTSSYIEVFGKIEDDLVLSEEITTQWISGFLFTLPLTSLKLRVENQKNAYVKLTMDMMKSFGIDVNYRNNVFSSNNIYQPSKVLIEGDLSNASFFINMSRFYPIEINNYNQDSIQGDVIYKDLVERIDSSIEMINIDMEDYPDLVIPLACFASVSGKEIKLSNLKKLRYKESDRIASIADVLVRLGAKVKIEGNCLIIYGQNNLIGGVSVDSYNDHRIVMGLVSIASKVIKPFTILNCEAVNKSFPAFFNVYKSIGGIYEISV